MCLCEDGNIVPLALQQMPREGAPKIVAVIHREKQNQENLAFLSYFMSSSGEKKNKYKWEPFTFCKVMDFFCILTILLMSFSEFWLSVIHHEFILTSFPLLPASPYHWESSGNQTATASTSSRRLDSPLNRKLVSVYSFPRQMFVTLQPKKEVHQILI